LDQTLGIASFLSLPPNRTAFTANLNINYRKPLPANTAIAIRTQTTKMEGRKLFVSGRVELLSDPNVLFADATALFIMPHAK
jgi:acyl-coenzyme A thioesterase PaaI-like protein